jgi:hypothetical protein
MTDFQKKRLAYFKKAAQNYDWVRLGLGDVEIFNEAEANELNCNAAASWSEKAEIIALKEEIERLMAMLNETP